MIGDELTQRTRSVDCQNDLGGHVAWVDLKQHLAAPTTGWKNGIVDGHGDNSGDAGLPMLHCL